MILKDKSKYSKIHILILTIIILVFFISNISIISKKDIFVDESITYYFVNTLSYKEILTGYDVHPPLYYLFVKSLPNHNNFTIIRMYSLIMAVIAIIFMSKIMLKHYSYHHSLLVTVLMSFSMTISHYSIEARMYSMLLLFSVVSFGYFLDKKYNYSLAMIFLMILTHYYAVFLLIPYVIVMFIYDRNELKKSLSESLKHVLITVSVLFVLLIVMSPYIYNQITNNPYKIPPPDEKTTLSSLPSMIIFPFVIPSQIESRYVIMFSFIVITLILYLIVTNSDKYNRYVQYFSSVSYITMIIFFVLGIFFLVPYHHRYTIMFYPMIFYMITNSVINKKINYQKIILAILIIYLVDTTINYHLNPQDTLIELSKDIKCPKNILHETPFTFLPMRMYFPNCNHYIGRTDYFSEINSITLYTEQEFIDNENINYDIYIHHFDEILVESLLINSDNITFIRLGE